MIMFISLFITTLNVSGISISNVSAESNNDCQLIWNQTLTNQGSYENEMTSLVLIGDFIYTYGDFTYYGNLTLQKWDTDGNLIWSKVLGTDDYEETSGKMCTDYSNLYTVGGTMNSPYEDGNLFLVKWDLDGNVVKNVTWEETYSIGSDILYLNNYLYVVGTNLTIWGPNTDIVLLKYNTDLELQWCRTWGGNNGEWGKAICTDGEKLYLGAQTASYGLGDYDALLMKWTIDGILEWNKTTGSSSWDASRAVWSDGTNIYLSGRANGAFFINKWNKDGSIVWNKTDIFSGISDRAQGLVGDNNYLYSCFKVGNGTLVKWDLDGNILWNLTWCPKGDSSKFNDLIIDNSNIYVIGQTFYFEDSCTWLIKYDIGTSVILSPVILGYSLYLILLVSVFISFIYLKKHKKTSAIKSKVST